MCSSCEGEGDCPFLGTPLQLGNGAGGLVRALDPRESAPASARGHLQTQLRDWIQCVEHTTVPAYRLEATTNPRSGYDSVDTIRPSMLLLPLRQFPPGQPQAWSQSIPSSASERLIPRFVDCGEVVHERVFSSEPRIDCRPSRYQHIVTRDQCSFSRPPPVPCFLLPSVTVRCPRFSTNLPILLA